MIQIDDIQQLWQARKTALGPLHAVAREVRDTYNGDITLPLPEMEENERAATANLILSGIDQTAMRISSTAPALEFPPLRRGIKKSEEYAKTRRLAVQGWHEYNAVPRKYRRRARWYLGYGCAPVLIRPNMKMSLPRWDLRDALSTYPAPTLDPDEINPPDCIFSFMIGREDLKARWPDKFFTLRKHKDTTKFQCLEYIDGEEHVLLVVGDEEPRIEWTNDLEGSTSAEELERFENRIDLCPVVIPGRITLDRRMGQFDGILGIYRAQAELMALNMIGTRRAILPEQWMYSNDNSRAEIITQANALTGVIGEIKGGKIETIRPDPSSLANPAMDRLEYAERQTAGIPAQYGGQGPTNVRTGRALDSVMSAVVDFPVQEAQERFEEAMHAENVMAMEIAKHYFGSKKMSFYVQKHATEVDYTPNEHFETTNHRVSYAYTGADQNNLSILTGQRIGMGTLSKKTAMRTDPMVSDVDAELDQIIAEGLEAAFLSSIQTQAADPAGPYQPADFARLLHLIKSDKHDLPEAVEMLQKEIQERQAQQQEGAMPGPEGMPGLAMPGAPGAPIEPIAEPEPSLQNLQKTLGTLRLGQMQGPAEKAS